MKAAEFARRRSSIEHDATHGNAWRKRAMARLASEAGAIGVLFGRQVVGWKLPGGEIVCIKQRYKNEERAEAYLRMIAATSGQGVKPIRAYACAYCHGLSLIHI